MKKIEFVGSVSVESLFDVYNLNGWEDEFVCVCLCVCCYGCCSGLGFFPSDP